METGKLLPLTSVMLLQCYESNKPPEAMSNVLKLIMSSLSRRKKESDMVHRMQDEVFVSFFLEMIPAGKPSGSWNQHI